MRRQLFKKSAYLRGRFFKESHFKGKEALIQGLILYNITKMYAIITNQKFFFEVRKGSPL